MGKLKLFLSVCITCFFADALHAQLRVASVFADNAVLQQGKYLPVWGDAPSGTQVVVEIGNCRVSAQTDEAGKWMVYLPPMQADGKSYELRIMSDNDTLCFRNVVVGEVWFASGQSNMEWLVKSGVENKEEEIRSANYPDIRMLTVPVGTSAQPESYFQKTAQWLVATPSTVSEFSAVGYFFARELHEKYGVPVGIINASRGATDIETWVSRDVLATMPFMEKKLFEQTTDTAEWNSYLRSIWEAERKRDEIGYHSTAGLKVGVQKPSYKDGQWNSAIYPVDMPKAKVPGFWGVIWMRKHFQLKHKGEAQLMLPVKGQAYKVYVNGKEVNIEKGKNDTVIIPANYLRKGKNVLALRLYAHWGDAGIGLDGREAVLHLADETASLGGEWLTNAEIEPEVVQWNNYYCRPSVSYNAMVAPIFPYAIRGIVWYQGENNVGRYKNYTALQTGLVNDWRIHFQQGYLPFLFVQLAGFEKQKIEPVENDARALFRAAQQKAAEATPNCGMASAADLGVETNIHPPFKQELAARLSQLAFSLAYDEDTRKSHPEMESVTVEPGRILIRFAHVENGLVLRTAAPSFALKSADGQWSWVDADVEQDHVVISYNGEQPVAVQYGWQCYPNMTLYDGAGWPVLPFYEIINH